MKETLEEAAEHHYPGGDDWTNEQAVIRRLAFINGANYQAERMYSEEDMIKFHKWAYQKNRIEESDKTTKELLKQWFEQFKKK